MNNGINTPMKRQAEFKGGPGSGPRKGHGKKIENGWEFVEERVFSARKKLVLAKKELAGRTAYVVAFVGGKKKYILEQTHNKDFATSRYATQSNYSDSKLNLAYSRRVPPSTL